MMLSALLVMMATALAEERITAYRVNSDAIKIDGKLDEDTWRGAAWLELKGRLYWGDTATQPDLPVAIIEGIKAQSGRVAKAAVLWDEKGIYFGIIAEDVDVESRMSGNNEWLWLEDAVEIFMAAYPVKAGQTHYEFQLNAQGTRFFNYQQGEGVLSLATGLKDCSYQSAVSVSGTLNNPSDQDKSWSGEWFFPWETLVKAGVLKAIPNLKQGEPVMTCRFGTWDLTVHSILRMNKYTLPGNYNSHQTEYYLPLYLSNEKSN